jgi:UDP-N-acetylglucosamine--N-acetylmuramyl-(pentapeptide) pyrophosphoryl-undecaprenol N-acetylglucosamine transferase
LFPAEALADALGRRGIAIALATDARGGRYGRRFPAREVHVIPSETLRARDPVSVARTTAMLTLGLVKAFAVLGRVRPAAVVGFGGYPTVPPVLAASLRGLPTVIHEQNAVMGRANKLLAARVSTIAMSFADIGLAPKLRGKAKRTGNPVRPAVVAAARAPFAPPEQEGLIRLLVFGGSQGARVFSDVVPEAIGRLSTSLRTRLLLAQQAREEDLDRVRAAYAQLEIAAEVASFFGDLPERIAAAHLVVSRSGAGTVAELAAIGRPSILVPLPHALDQDQFANAGTIADAGGAIRLRQDEFTPERLAAEIGALASTPEKLLAMAAAARSQGAIDAAERLADLVIETIRNSGANP